MYIVFSDSQIYTLPEWLYEESLYLKYDYIYGKNYSIEEITVNPSFQKKEVWDFFKRDLPYIHFPQILQSFDFASFFYFLKMKKDIGFYIEPQKYNIQNIHLHSWIHGKLSGFQLFGISNIQYRYDTFPISIIYETIQKNDSEWLYWGLKYIDYRDYDTFLDEKSFQLIYEYKAFDCIPVILEMVDIFTDYLKEKYQIDIENELDEEEVIEKIRIHQLQMDIFHLGKKIKKLKML